MEFLTYTIVFHVCLFIILILSSIRSIWNDSWCIDIGIGAMFLGCMWVTLKLFLSVGRG